MYSLKGLHSQMAARSEMLARLDSMHSSRIELPQQSGACGCVNRSWNKKVKERKKEIDELESLDNYVAKKDIVPTHYLIHDNGGRPFMVDVTKKGIDIRTYTQECFEPDWNWDNLECYNVPVHHIKAKDFQGYWWGYDTSPNKMHGNTVLIKLTDHKYILVGWIIYEITTVEPITDFFAEVGNSDVPYPIAYSDNFVYFLIDYAYVPKKNLCAEANIANADKMYGYFYGHVKCDKMKRSKPIKLKLIRERVGW